MLVFFNEAGMLTHTDTGVAYPCPDAQRDMQTGPGQIAVDVPPFSPAYWYLNEGQLTMRPRLPYTVKDQPEGNAYLMTLDGLPAGVTVIVDGSEQGATMSDGEPLEIEFRQPGEYRVSLALWPYQPETLTRTFTPAEK